MQLHRSKGASKPRPRRGKEQRARQSSSDVPALKRSQALPEAALAIAVPVVEKAEACWLALKDDPTPEHVHQFRVAIRQLRVVLHIFRKQDASGDFKALRAALKQAASEVGRKRDIDVMIADLVQPLAHDAEGEDIPRLIDALEQQREAAKEDLRQAVETDAAKALRERLPHLPDQLVSAVDAIDNKTTIAKFAERDLRKRWRHIEGTAEKLDTLSPPELHEMRKSIKKLRYAFGHFSPLYDKKDGHKFTKALQRLQDAFGYLNDVTGARKSGERFKAKSADPELAYAAGYVLGRHAERARDVRRRIGKSWKRLTATDLAKQLGGK